MKLPLFESEELAHLIKKGSPAFFPTDTLPALAGAPEYASKLWEIKSRPKTKPFILMGASADELLKDVFPEALEDAYSMGSSYWPGALTIVVPTIGETSDLNPFGSSIGLRVPSCQLAIRLLSETGPLATTSANLSGQDSLMNPEDIARCFPDIPMLGPMPWPKLSGLASTLIEWKGPGQWQLLRQGAVIPSEL